MINISFSKRSHEKEIMDDYTANDDQWARFYDDLSWINRYVFGKRLFTTGIKALCKDLSLTSQPLTLADFACGGGTTLNTCALWAKNKSLPIRFFGYDINPILLQYAYKSALDLPVVFEKQDLFSSEFSKKTFDIIICNLFCHHLTDEEIIGFFNQMHQQAQKGVIINDLQRHWLAYLGFNMMSFFKKLSPITKHDGLISIKKGFTKQEIIYLLQQAQIKHYKISWRFPFYYNIIIYKKVIA